MHKPPPLSSLARYPVTGAVGVAAIVVTLAWVSGRNIEPLVMNSLAWHGQPWRLLTSALPHVGWIHLFFNLSWLWVFGTLIEERFGSVRTLALIVLLAATSAAAEYTFFRGGVGLSGVVYGFFGFLWVLQTREPRFADAMDERTTVLFVVWFFVCIFLTVAKILPVGNVAHGCGAVVGAGVGAAVVVRGAGRTAARLMLIVLSAAIFGCAAFLRPTLNVGGAPDTELEKLGYEALVVNDNENAYRYLRAATAMRHADFTAWYNLGIASQRLGRSADAERAYRRAAELDPQHRRWADVGDSSSH